MIRIYLSLHSWLTALENTKWLQHLSLLLKSAVIIVNAIEEGHPVVVHCTDGWDRTPQLVALAELMLDPYYRTLEVMMIIRKGKKSILYLYHLKCSVASVCIIRSL